METDHENSDRVLEKVRALRDKWISRFDIKKKNSIALQLTNITWDITCFKIVDEAVRLAPESPDGGRQLNGAVYNLLTRSFAKGLMADIRKLVDSRKNTVSLRRLLEEIRRESRLLTRQLVFAVEGIEYDSTDSLRREKELFDDQERQGKSFMYGLPFEESPDRINSRHEQLDFLCEVSSDGRKPTDCMSDRLLQNLVNSLDAACGTIKDYVDKNIAHAGEVMNQERTLEIVPTWGAIYDAHRVLCRVAGFVHLHILGFSQLPFSPMPGLETLVYVSRPLVGEADVEKVYQAIQDFWKDCNELSEWKPMLDPKKSPD